MPGKCEFTYDSNDYRDYEYNFHYDYEIADEDKEQCLQSCLQQRRSVDGAAGCYFQKPSGQCNFLKTGTIIGGSGDSDIGTCWKFGEGYSQTSVGHKTGHQYAVCQNMFGL